MHDMHVAIESILLLVTKSRLQLIDAIPLMLICICFVLKSQSKLKEKGIVELALNEFDTDIK